MLMSREPFVSYLIQFIDEQDKINYHSIRKLNAHLSKNSLEMKIFEQAKKMDYLACSGGSKRRHDVTGFQEFCIIQNAHCHTLPKANFNNILLNNSHDFAFM